MKSEKKCYKYNSVYKFFVHALQLDPPQPPFKRGEPEKSPAPLQKGGAWKVPLIKGDLGG